jgi:signal transduction histidine kinase
MKSLYLRIWLTVMAALALFAIASGWLLQRHLEQEQRRTAAAQAERVAAWGDLLQLTLPLADAPQEEQAAALREWSQRLRLPLALDSAEGDRIAASESFVKRESDPQLAARRPVAVRMDDGRTLWIIRVGAGKGNVPGPQPPNPVLLPFWPSPGVNLAVLLVLLFVAVTAGAYPVVRRLTRGLERLKRGVEAFGAGTLSVRVDAGGGDEVAAVAGSFNRAAAHIEALVQSHRSLLANASHELRSPLARMKMALAMLDSSAAPRRAELLAEIEVDIGELNALVEEVLLASRLDSGQMQPRRDPVDLLALAAEEGSRVHAQVDGEEITAAGDERLLRRALRNLLENARRYGGGDVSVRVGRNPASRQPELRVDDRGPGVPPAFRDRIFEPFFRLPGHAEQEGGVGLGLALVRQIATGHGGRVHCEPREGGGTSFVLTLAA